MARGKYGQSKPIEATTDDLTIGGGDLIGSDPGEDTKLRLIESRAQRVVDNVVKLDCQPALVTVAGDMTTTGNITASDPTADTHVVTKQWALANLASSGSGGGTVAVRTVANSDSPVTLTSSDYFVLCNTVGGQIIVNLPAASGLAGKRFQIKRIGAGSASVTVQTSDGLDGGSSFVLSEPFAAVSAVCDGSEFYIF